MKDDTTVEFSRDDGFKHQWGAGKFFYTREGGKIRVNRKAVMWIISVCFASSAMVGLFKDTSSFEVGETSPVSVSSKLISNEHIEVPEYLSSQEKTQSAAVSKPRASRKIMPGSLALVKRNPKVEVPPGTMVKARFVSGASNGFVKAVLVEPVKVNGEVLLKAETQLLGTGQSSKERLIISFTQVVLNDGSFYSTQAQACDPSDKMPGIAGKNVRGQALNLLGAIGLNFAGGMALGLQQKAGGEGQGKPTTKDALLNGAALASLERAKELSQEMKSTPPLIEVESETEFYVLFLGQQ